MFLADVIFPAFSAPYFADFFFPMAAGLAIASEILVFKFRYKSLLSWFRACWFAILANIVSWIFGLILSLILPSGLVPKVERAGDHPISIITQGPNFTILMICGFILAYLLSICIEYAVWRRLLKSSPLPSLFTTCIIANTVSYCLLVSIAYAYIHFNWW
ncbi:MAG: hypothetical protein PHD76_01195 [Methylacidiphilales bacterium]|nr:hypothetical protein [Candidatus Methylacidiphilales bacterium]